MTGTLSTGSAGAQASLTPSEQTATMKLQVTLLAVGIALSAGAVGIELNRSANVTSITQPATGAISASQSSLKQSATSSQASTLSSSRPIIKGGSGDD